MDKTAYIQLLEEHDIKPTANRIVVVEADKSNIFRALTLFREQHLVHTIEGGNDGTRYELCHSHSHDHDDDQHPHFYCEVCQQTYCLDGVEVPQLDVPQGFKIRSVNYIIKGICPHCHTES